MRTATTQVYDLDGNPVETIALPEVFDAPLRPDVIKRAVLAIQSHRIQPQGRNPMAGKRTTAESRGTGLGIARLPRVKGRRYPRAGQAALAPGTVGGRQPHPPRAEKRIRRRINRKERLLALRSAIAATASKDIVASRGHAIGDVLNLPLVISNELQEVEEAGKVRRVLQNIGFWPDVVRAKRSRRVRAGKGKMRGRKTKQAVGPLIVVAEDDGIVGAARNHPGVDVITVDGLNAELLAPGTHPGRLTVWTKAAVERLEDLSK
ncbi:MAG: 50S ribosomal protein L4 [Candidatus Bathyarchaeia archaeon]